MLFQFLSFSTDVQAGTSQKKWETSYSKIAIFTGFSVHVRREGERGRWITLYLSLPNQIKYFTFFFPFFLPL